MPKVVDDSKLLDWPEGLKKLQENWIGKSVGLYVEFIEEKTKEAITVFTTRADNLAGELLLSFRQNIRWFLALRLQHKKMRSKNIKKKQLQRAI